jgi:SseB protein N-terminal domain
VSGDREIRGAGERFRDDAGAVGEGVRAALEGYAAGRGTEQGVLTALASARLLVPVVAVLGEVAADGGEKDSTMALPTLIGNDGRAAIIAFTGLAALAGWRPDARPVPVEAGRVWQAAVADGQAVVIDVAGPVPVVVEGARLAALAAGQPPPAAHEDPDIRAEVEAAIVPEDAIAGARVTAGRAGGDLAVQFVVRPDAADWEPAVRRAATQLSGRLAARLRRGIEIGAATAAQ